MIRSFAVVVITVTLLACSPSGGPGSDGELRPSGAILYSRFGVPYAIDVDSDAASVAAPVPIGASPWEMDVSSDATRVVFADENDLRVASATGADEVLLDEGFVHTPRWSPDGAFVTAIEVVGALGDMQAIIVDPVTGTVERVGPMGLWTEARLSADGRLLALSGNNIEARRVGLWVGPVTDAGHFELVVASREPITFSWSPLEPRLAVSTPGKVDEEGDPVCDGEGWKVRTMNADGSDARRLTDGVHLESDPVWSPDGKWIAFLSTRGSDDDPDRCPSTFERHSPVWITTVDGEEARLVEVEATLLSTWASSVPAFGG